ncbi:transcriptional regulator [Streptococcus dysgalactiae subsp. equisimilis]|uniref:response regulator transcription factor n=1 Tax=Streptococcus dysgalactiae TaxID=1334 RepID=UPI0012C4C284|nr:response regulator transcription factor [Streptococcus dysgalactiae]GET85319.1 transcriptional regulator [Streptococcus dysgalactiae subsp. equisimilis]HEO2029739.1 response regulator transcription factor [Streptococcus agalactiae]
MKHILVIEDEPLIRDEIVILLEKAGYQVGKITDFKETTKQVQRYETDLIILDLNLPGETGFQICKNLKTKSSIPILVLTSREQLKDEIYALKLGADEYLTKPFRKERLLARIENLLKRYEGRKNLLEKDNFLLDRNTYTLYIDGNSILLPQNQGKLLEALLTTDDNVVTKEDLSMKLWNTTEFIDENALQVNITRLKKVMKEVGIAFQVKSVRGIGYKLERVVNNEE